MNILTIQRALLQQRLRELLRRRMNTFPCPTSISRWDGNVELLVRPGGASERFVLLATADDLTLPRALPNGYLALLQIGVGERRGQAAGLVQFGDRPEPLHLVKTVGPGMHTLMLEGHGLQRSASDVEGGPGAQERWSRTIGALGMDVWQRLCRLRYGVIGNGRTGSIVARSLAHLGARRLTLIDPDILERHNLGEMEDTMDAALGLQKAEALASSLSSRNGPLPEILPVNESVTHLRSLHAARACDVLVACVDHDGARLATATIATLFCKPLLDVATGIMGRGASRVMGADVRLILPGSCLLCLGGLRDEAQARRVLASSGAESTFYANRNWRSERAGSLHSLNQVAAAVALRLLEDFVGERVQQSTWVHVEFDLSGRLSVTYPDTARRSGAEGCPLCALSCLGEEGLASVSDLFSEENGSMG